MHRRRSDVGPAMARIERLYIDAARRGQLAAPALQLMERQMVRAAAKTQSQRPEPPRAA